MDLALFDFDHTITTRDTFTDFVHCALPWRRLAPGRLPLAPTIAGYRPGRVSADTIRARVVRVGFTGLPQRRIQEAARRFARDALPHAIRPGSMRDIERRRLRGGDRSVGPEAPYGPIGAPLSPGRWVRAGG